MMLDIKQLICKDLSDQKVISLRTDTVNGLICIANSDRAVTEIYSLKNREVNKPVGIVVNNLEMVEKYIALTPIIRKLLLDASYSFTVIAKMNKNNGLSQKLNQLNDNIALRIPKHKLLLEIIKTLSTPIVATSANKSGKRILNNAHEISKEFGDKVKFYPTTNSFSNTPSAIIDCTKNQMKIIRATKLQEEYIWSI